MKSVHLVRHGEVANPNHIVYADLPGFDLSPRGVRQVHRAGLHLSTRKVDAVITSPLARAVHTAIAIGGRHDLEVILDAGLTETRMYPSWTGMRWEDVETRFPDQLRGYLGDPTVLPDTRESVAQLAIRMRDVLTRSFLGGRSDVVLVSHQDPVSALHLTLLGHSLSELTRRPPTHASVTTLVTRDGARWIETETWAPDGPDTEDEAGESRYTHRT